MTREGGGAEGPREVRVAESDEEIRRCFAVLSQLRPHLEEAELVPRIRRMQAEGFLLAALEEEGEVRAVAGYRYLDLLHTGRTLYVDDLVTDAEHRSRGHGAALFRWLAEQARLHGCATLTLDSGVQRFEAHRFYLRERMSIVSHHFSLPLDP
jgi:GNAT superfamily N-acetyltransferase